VSLEKELSRKTIRKGCSLAKASLMPSLKQAKSGSIHIYGGQILYAFKLAIVYSILDIFSIPDEVGNYLWQKKYCSRI
jgi:hypothetical protein